MGLTVTRTATTQSPLSAARLREHLRGSEVSDTYLVAMASAATGYAETYTGRVLLTSTVVLTLERFAEVIRLPGSPVQAVQSIRYIDSVGAMQTLSPSLYRTTGQSEPVRITRAYSASWPTPRNETEAVTITYTAGYGESLESAPQEIQYAVLLLVEHYHDPEAKAALYQAERLLNGYRLGVHAAFGGLDNQCAVATSTSE